MTTDGITMKLLNDNKNKVHYQNIIVINQLFSLKNENLPLFHIIYLKHSLNKYQKTLCYQFPEHSVITAVKVLFLTSHQPSDVGLQCHIIFYVYNPHTVTYKYSRDNEFMISWQTINLAFIY